MNNKDSPIVYICSPYSGDVEANVKKARAYSRLAVDRGCVPLTPHLFLPAFISEETERETALKAGLKLLSVCREIWVCGGTVSSCKRQSNFQSLGSSKIQSLGRVLGVQPPARKSA